MATLGRLLIKIGADLSELDKGINSASSKIGKAGRDMQQLGGNLTRNVTLPLVGIGTAATVAFTQLNSAMGNVQSLGVAQDRVLELRDSVQEMAVDVGKSTGDLADGLYQVISAFGDTSDTVNVLEINARAAAAGLATTTDAINLTSAVTKGYGDTSAESVQQVADLAFVAVQLGQTTFPELAASIGRVVPIAANLNITQEELFATMATLTGVTGNAAEVSTQLRGGIQALMAPTESMAGLMNNLGFANGAAMIEQLGFAGSMQAIVEAAAASGEPLQNYLASIEGQTLALALAGPQAENYVTKLAAMQEAAGAADAAFVAQTEGVNANGFAMQQAAIKGQVLLEKLGEGLAPALVDVMDAATPLINKVVEMANKFADLDPATQKNIVKAVALVAAIGPVITIVGTLATGISGIIGLFTTLGPIISGAGTVIGLLSNPIGWIVAAVALLGLAWSTNFLGIRDKTEEILGKVREWFTSINWTELGLGIINGIKNGIVNGAQAVADAARNAALGALNAAKNLLGIHSPSTAFMQIGQFTMQGLAQGLRMAQPEPVAVMAETGRAMMGAGGDTFNVNFGQTFQGQADAGQVQRAARAGVDSVLQLRRQRGY